MKEKIRYDSSKKWVSGYFKPKGKWQKRRIHKKLRRLKGKYRDGIMNRIGVHWDWS